MRDRDRDEVSDIFHRLFACMEYLHRPYKINGILLNPLIL